MQYVDQAFFMIIDLFAEAFELVLPVVTATFVLILTAALTRMVLSWIAGGSQNMMADFIVLFIVFSICLGFAAHAKQLVDGLGRFALELGTMIVGAGTMTPNDFGPSALWWIGDDQAQKIMQTSHDLCTTFWECTKTFVDRIMLELAAISIWIAFAFLIFEMTTTAIGYNAAGLFTLLFVPMAGLPMTKSFAEGAIQGWINHAVKLTIIAMVSGIGSRTFELLDLPAHPVFDDIMPALLMSVFIAFLAWQSRALAAGIVSAVPQLSGQSIVRAGGNVMRSVAGGVGAATTARLVSGNEKASVLNAARNISQGLGRAPGRISNAAKAVRSGDVAKASYWKNVRAANASAGPSGGSGGGGGGSPRRGGAWDGPPSNEQAFAAKKRKVDISGMTKGEASVALERAGMDASWYDGGGSAAPKAAPAQKPSNVRPMTSRSGYRQSSPGQASSRQASSGGSGGGGSSGTTKQTTTSSPMPQSSRPRSAPSKAYDPDDLPPPPEWASDAVASGPSRAAPSPTSAPAPTGSGRYSREAAGRYLISDGLAERTGLGGGWANTGYKGAGWKQPSLRRSGTAALTGQAAAARTAAAPIRELHFGNQKADWSTPNWQTRLASVPVAKSQ